MRSGRFAGDGYFDPGSVGFEFVDRLVGEPDPVELAALEQTDDDFKQPLVGGAAAVIFVIGIPVIGIIAAIAIPNLLSAIQRGKQKRTMGDLKTVASAIEQYNTDNNHYPVGHSMDELCKVLTPDYLVECIRKDGWSTTEHPQEFRYLAWEGDPKGCPAAGSAPAETPPAVTDKGDAPPAETPPEAACGPVHYVIASAGKDGRFEHEDLREYHQRDTGSFNNDIVIGDGRFIQAPNGKQSNGPAD